LQQFLLAPLKGRIPTQDAALFILATSLICHSDTQQTIPFLFLLIFCTMVRRLDAYARDIPAIMRKDARSRSCFSMSKLYA
jgi:hypothetical protein